MDRYQKGILAIVIIMVISGISYAVLIILGLVDTYFPFFIFFPGSLVIWIPIIVRKRLNELNKKEQLRKDLEE
ncbi:MAG: hypothetical protein ACXAEX_07130 [Promethearchaeota archaeon]|jgi:hypothetical protein